jgi:hypothetical protein
MSQNKVQLPKAWIRWNDNLTDLKNKSIDAHVLWVSCGRPRVGDVFNLQRCAKANYKRALRNCDKDVMDSVSNDLNDFLLCKDLHGFWKTWDSKFSTRMKIPVFVDGTSDVSLIADKFAAAFKNACTYNSVPNNNKLYDEFSNYKVNYFENYENVDVVDCSVSVELVDKCIKNMKLKKAAGLDNIESEHLLYAHPLLVLLLKLLFNSILHFGYVPDNFGCGVMIPVIKDRNGSASSIDNYRGITLSSNVSKLFEMCLLDLYDSFLYSSDLQFGFKKKLAVIVPYILSDLSLIILLSMVQL